VNRKRKENTYFPRLWTSECTEEVTEQKRSKIIAKSPKTILSKVAAYVVMGAGLDPRFEIISAIRFQEAQIFSRIFLLEDVIIYDVLC